MNHFTLEEYYNDYDLHRRLYAEAHRQRALALRDGFAFLLAGLARLVRRLTPQLHRRQGRWIERLG